MDENDSRSKYDEDSPEIDPLKKLEHKLRNPLNTIANVIELARHGALPEDVVAMGRRAMKRMTQIISQPLQQSVSLYSLERLHEMLKDKIQQTINIDTKLHLKDMNIVLEEITDEMQEYMVQMSDEVCATVSDILLPNAKQADAQNIHITFKKCIIDGNREVIQIIVSDDGKGIDMNTLADIRQGKKISTKPHDGEDHGIGLCDVRDLIKRCKGTMIVDSIHKNEDPENHHTTFTFVFPCIKASKVQQDTQQELLAAEQVQAQMQTHSGINRRTMMKVMLGGATAATVTGGIAWYAGSHQKDKQVSIDTSEKPHSSVTDIVMDKGTISSFTMNIGGKAIIYERGQKNDAFQYIKDIDTADGSLVAFQPTPAEGLQSRGMFLASTPEGVFGFVDTQHKAIKAGYLCVPHEASASSLRVSDDHVFPLQDTVFKKRLHASNAALLQSSLFASMRDSLRKAATSFGTKQNANYNGNVGMILNVLLHAHDSYMQKHATAQTIDEWKAYLEERDQFIIAQKQVIDALRKNPLTPQETAELLKRNIDVCLLDVQQPEAQAIIHT